MEWVRNGGDTHRVSGRVGRSPALNPLDACPLENHSEEYQQLIPGESVPHANSLPESEWDEFGRPVQTAILVQEPLRRKSLWVSKNPWICENLPQVGEEHRSLGNCVGPTLALILDLYRFRGLVRQGRGSDEGYPLYLHDGRLGVGKILTVFGGREPRPEGAVDLGLTLCLEFVNFNFKTRFRELCKLKRTWTSGYKLMYMTHHINVVLVVSAPAKKKSRQTLTSCSL